MAKHQLVAGQHPGTGSLRCFTKAKNPSASISCGLFRADYFARQGTTVLLLEDLTTDNNDKTVHSIAHGVIRLEEIAPEYGAERRRLRVVKYRGRGFRGGFHDFI